MVREVDNFVSYIDYRIVRDCIDRFGTLALPINAVFLLVRPATTPDSSCIPFFPVFHHKLRRAALFSLTKPHAGIA